VIPNRAKEGGNRWGERRNRTQRSPRPQSFPRLRCKVPPPQGPSTLALHSSLRTRTTRSRAPPGRPLRILLHLHGVGTAPYASGVPGFSAVHGVWRCSQARLSRRPARSRSPCCSCPRAVRMFPSHRTALLMQWLVRVGIRWPASRALFHPSAEVASIVIDLLQSRLCSCEVRLSNTFCSRSSVESLSRWVKARSGPPQMLASHFTDPKGAEVETGMGVS
jgi:hypothetical protein